MVTSNVGGQLSLGGSTTLLGLIVVFAVLFILIGMIWVLSKICAKVGKSNEARTAKKAAKAAAKKAAAAEVQQAPAEQQTEAPKPARAPEAEAVGGISGETVAAITAAVAIMMDVPVSGVKLRSVRKLASRSERHTAWGRAGRSEQLNSWFQ